MPYSAQEKYAQSSFHLVRIRDVKAEAGSDGSKVHIQGGPKRPDTFESLIKIKPVDENRKCSHFWKAYSMPFCVEYAKHEHYIL